MPCVINYMLWICLAEQKSNPNCNLLSDYTHTHIHTHIYTHTYTYILKIYQAARSVEKYDFHTSGTIFLRKLKVGLAGYDRYILFAYTS